MAGTASTNINTHSLTDMLRLRPNKTNMKSLVMQRSVTPRQGPRSDCVLCYVRLEQQAGQVRSYAPLSDRVSPHDAAATKQVDGALCCAVDVVEVVDCGLWTTLAPWHSAVWCLVVGGGGLWSVVCPMVPAYGVQRSDA